MSKVVQNQKPVYAFIDSQNLNLGVQSQGWKLDFKKFRVYLKDSYGVSKAFLFVGYIPEYQKLYDKLGNSGYELIFKPVIEKTQRGQVVIKGNVDSELVLHTMAEFPNYNGAVIVSGDGDFHCLAKYLEQNGKLTKIIVPNYKYSSLLREFGNYITVVTMFKNKVEKK